MSSVSYADANQENPIHAHQIAKNTTPYFATGAATAPPANA
jgi:hypothetical protein